MMKLISQIVLILLLVIGVIAFLASVIGGVHDFSLYYSYFLVIIAALFWLGSMVAGIIAKPASLVRALIGLGAFVLVAILSYALADSKVYAYYVEGTTESVSKFSGAGIMMFYFLLGGAVFSIIFSAFSRLIR